jgi:hypothetical protein
MKGQIGQHLFEVVTPAQQQVKKYLLQFPSAETGKNMSSEGAGA